MTNPVTSKGTAPKIICQAAIIAGKGRPIAGIPFPDDNDNLERLSVAGFSNADQGFTNPFFATWDSAFQIEQM